MIKHSQWPYLPHLQAHVLFLKPVQTGFPADCDSRLLVSDSHWRQCSVYNMES